MDPSSPDGRSSALLGPGMVVAFLLVAFTWGDYVLGLATPDLGDAHWRFAAASALTVPLWWALVGSVLLLWFAQTADWRSGLKLGAGFCLFQALIFILALGIFPLDFIAMRRDIAPEAQWGFRVASARIALKLLAASALFIWLGLAGFRAASESVELRDDGREIPLIVGMDRD